MDALENLFSKENEIVEKLKEYATKPDYKKIFFDNLGPELRKIYENKKDKVIFKNFLNASHYEYGFFGKKIDLKKAFSLYKEYADSNDYMCMYKMHIIYLCEYEKFNVPFSRVLEKIYLIKCFSYIPNYIFDWDLKLFETIDVIYEIAEVLDLEDGNLEKHQIFFDLLEYQREKYNLSENDIHLMRGAFRCYFHKDEDQSESNILALCQLNSILPKNEFDYAYYTAKNKCVFFRTHLNLEKIIPDSEIEIFYQDIKNKKLYDYYIDYGNYLLDKKTHSNKEIIDLFKIVSDKGYVFSSFRLYQCLIDYYNFDEIMTDYNMLTNLLNYLLDEVIFENVLLKQFTLLIGLVNKYSQFSNQINSKYLVYLKEINSHTNSLLKNKEEKKEIITEEEEYLFTVKAIFYYFGFKDIEQQNLKKCIDFLDKGNDITKKIYIKKGNEFLKFNSKKLMNEKKLISNGELIQAKKDLIEFYSKYLNLKYQTIDCYIMGDAYFEGIIKKKDEFNAIVIYQEGQKIFCKTMMDCLVKSKIKKFLKIHENKIENKFKDEICCICYDKKVNKLLIPCKHNFCSNCVEKLEKDSKCPVCRSEVLCII